MTNRAFLPSLKKILLYVLLFVFLTPFLLIIMNSFKSTQQFVENPLSLPTGFQLNNYVSAFDNMNFLDGFLNSLLITVGSVVLILFFSSMTGYLFVRFKWRINSIFFYAMLASLALPFQVLMIPLVMLYGNMSLLDSKLTLLFMYLGFGVPFGVFTFHGFIKGIPFELEESAFIEGSSRMRTFFQIVLPLLRPVFVTLIVLDVLWIWNDYLLPSLVLLSPEHKTLPLSTYNFFSSYSVDYAPLMAGLIMTIIPVLIMYLLLQKQIIKGITEGALK
ncbi:carbohydrate ABC transporter permease [Paenibacillus silvae]|uniref:Carbohydrate ABC transporter permease n=1 Tax=Paenibacillus silvae TaxID=1325358 RepID=A0A2W6NL78_9BACL|nr:MULTISPECIES: carbohydrate ABC transporter permease [Paenibacillus]MCK6074193.1 carbohydrate ABC transporter permease [Paenibacillus silvae]MCK6148329.1 carbohydrate ABC transporter permease [Paenibacillus silvae]MCK6266629.1 carbohydrate ABC transporter permease [Paenibacillus silvae]PZT55878.1 carbohydrate ABC transporter permease [Paenibacillus silvae]GGH58734.1 sugar ABC transporter permease [Paenibacillus silvae]